jgi:uncharacterized protein (DUF302 family)
MNGILAERGFAVRPVLVFDVCRRRYSGDLLSNDGTLFVSSMMPCSVAIYQTNTVRGHRLPIRHVRGLLPGIGHPRTGL